MIRLPSDQLITGDERHLPILHPGYLQDQMVRARNINLYGEDSLCKSCQGTGNAFYLHFKACDLCRGTGIFRRSPQSTKQRRLSCNHYLSK